MYSYFSLYTQITFVPSTEIQKVKAEPINYWLTYIKQYMNYGDHNFIQITQQTKLRVAPVALIVSNASTQSSVPTAEPSVIWAYLTEAQHGVPNVNVTPM